ncbi:SusD/RagB family nutrient-binding outer membrane lipoprotein [Hymenobacter humi]|uniref:SusD/RagB family nutrient-binding outer membrane lipoprotein n=1 Tax=Hymenobacter humi TaxID=1411620 RepID=A0ABW2U371_9BACT
MLATAATGCKDFLDINTNVNSPTKVLPDAILASALSTTAANYNGNNPSYNHFASFAAGYWGKSGVVNGYTEERTYNYTNTFQQGLWSATYDNLNDYNLIQTEGTANGYPRHAAIARIMKVYNFQLLVDEYGDIPYFTALQGAANTAPTYDKAQDIYKDFIVQLNGAIADIDAAGTTGTLVGNEDIVFRGDMVKWKQFANSLKLRVLLRQAEVASLLPYVKTELAALQTAKDGFITTDVVAQPGYAQAAGQQNPFYNRYGFTSAGSNALEQLYQLPTNYIINQYVENKDPRVVRLYTVGGRTVAGVTTPGYIGTDLGERSPPSFTAPLVASRFLNGGGLLKGANAPTVLMLLSEHLFSKAEVEARSLGLTGVAKDDYMNGIKASFMYFYRSATGAATSIAAATATTAGVPEYEKYILDNAANPKVDYTLAPSKQNVILYQKYLAMNSVASTEAWADFRRTGQPKFNISLEATTPGKISKRLIYPLSEVSTNEKNIPAGTDQYTPIFWDVLD